MAFGTGPYSATQTNSRYFCLSLPKGWDYNHGCPTSSLKAPFSSWSLLLLGTGDHSSSSGSLEATSIVLSHYLLISVVLHTLTLCVHLPCIAAKLHCSLDMPGAFSSSRAGAPFLLPGFPGPLPSLKSTSGPRVPLSGFLYAFLRIQRIPPVI